MKKIFIILLIMLLSTVILKADRFSERFVFKKDTEGKMLIVSIPTQIKNNSKVKWAIFSYSEHCLLNDIIYRELDSCTITEIISINAPIYFLNFVNIWINKNKTRYQSQNKFKGFLKMNKDEIIGYQGYVWFMEYYDKIKDVFESKKDKVILTKTASFDFMDSSLSHEKALEKAQKNGVIVTIDYDEFQRIDSKRKLFSENYFPRFSRPGYSPFKPELVTHFYKLLIDSTQPIATDTPITANVPILLIDEKNHVQRTDSQDWRIYAYLNQGNGMFYQYVTFEKELDYYYPLYVRDFAMDYLAGVHQCKNSTVLVKNKPQEKVVKKNKGHFDKKIFMCINKMINSGDLHLSLKTKIPFLKIDSIFMLDLGVSSVHNQKFGT